jgi:Tfp pilus assembly protein PilE
VSAGRLRLGIPTLDSRAARVRRRPLPARSSPFSPFEAVLVVVVIAIAVGVAVPDYLRMTRHDHPDAATTPLQSAAAMLDRYHAEAGTYVGAPLPAGVQLVSAGRATFCIETSSRGAAWHTAGPAGKPVRGSC